MLRSSSIALLFILVFTFGVFGTVNATNLQLEPKEDVGAEPDVVIPLELRGDTWSTSQESDVVIPSGGYRCTLKVENDALSGRDVLYSLIFKRNDGDEKVLTAGVLKPGDNKEEYFFIGQRGNYTLKLDALVHTYYEQSNGSPKATAEMQMRINGCFPNPPSSGGIK